MFAMTYVLVQPTASIAATESHIEEGQGRIGRGEKKGENREGDRNEERRRDGDMREEGDEEVILPECSICLTDINIGEKCRILPYCNHLYHSVCVDVWFKCSVCCPLCKRSMREILNNGNSNAAASFL